MRTDSNANLIELLGDFLEAGGAALVHLAREAEERGDEALDALLRVLPLGRHRAVGFRLQNKQKNRMIESRTENLVKSQASPL